MNYKIKIKNPIYGAPATLIGKLNKGQFKLIDSPDAGILPPGWTGVHKQIVDDYFEAGGTGCLKAGSRLALFYDYNGRVGFPFKRILIQRTK